MSIIIINIIFVNIQVAHRNVNKIGSDIADTPTSIGLPPYVPGDESIENSTEREVRLTINLYKII